MQFRPIPWLLWLVPIGLLVVAIERLPYGYYTFTRFVVCGFAALLAYLAWEGEGVASRTWAIVFGLMAILFNPFVPVYLKRATWAYFDIGCALIFAAHLIFIRWGWFGPKTKRIAYGSADREKAPSRPL
jgi:uncharacterized protein DUF6804